ncbi:MAG: L-glutamate gamma-semialdehyde dehydrogenase, partial [Phycisphaerales bacterium]|nr:L-glutamate gamma-semialdehyde dehydrogenase [Phycisphaerales bacterium]
NVAASRFDEWRRTPVVERADVLTDVARLMLRDRFELAAIASFECAKPWREADADIAEAIDFCNYYACEMLRLSRGTRRRDVPGETNEYFYRPRGVVAVIAPWNFPLAILTGMTAAALVTGNTVVMKPAEQSPVIAYRLMELFEEAGLPKGVLNYVPGPGEEVGDELVRHANVAMTVFTGSRAVGTHINRVCADILTDQPGIKKVIAEMGGKNATIVDSDADLDEAVKGVLHAAFGYAGQKCSASSRCIVLDAVYDRFVRRLVEAARSLQVGPADDCGTFVPPVIDEESYERCLRYIEIGKGEAKLALQSDTSGLVAETGGYYVGPTIFLDTPPEARIAQEEIFGPILAVIRARDIAHAIEIYNGTEYALTGGIFSRSPAHIERAREECECGNFYINRKITGALVDLQPFGGFRMSGMGSKAGGPDYLLQFCEPRTVTENTMRRGFAPSEKVAETLRA